MQKADLTVAQIRSWVDAFRDKNPGKWPSSLSGDVLDADGNPTGETWVGLNSIFIYAAKGAPARGLRGCGFTSLSDFLDQTYPNERNIKPKGYLDADILGEL